ncbi:hypothetical protein F5887DRAFT_238366 [Amanita rubescens]|nr:hypothetical protein F5887DRAFT_238366 [Amanita rubescens]
MSFQARIPTETLCEIFHLLCDTQPILLHVLENSSDGFPWVLGQVCRRWRAVFLSHPPLWTILSLQPREGHFSPTSLTEMGRRTAVYLKRSGQSSLSITAELSSKVEPAIIIWRMLLSCSNRWKWASLNVYLNNSAIEGLLGCRGMFSTLEYLEMRIGTFGREPSHTFEIAPCLINLRLSNNIFGPGCIGKWKFPWAQLTKVKISTGLTQGSDEVRATLFQLQNVEELRLEIPFMRDFVIDKHSPVFRFARLRRFNVSMELAVILYWFDTPLLEHLEINDRFIFTHRGENTEEVIASLIYRSSCHIRRLTLEDCQIEAIRLVLGVRALTASVEELFIEHRESSGLSRLIRDINERSYLPKLHVLRLKCCFNEFMAATPYLLEVRGEESEFVASHDIAPLLRVTVQFRSCRNPRCEDPKSFANDCPFIKLSDTGDRQPDSIQIGHWRGSRNAPIYDLVGRTVEEP